MKKIFIPCFIFVSTLSVTSCYDESKLPYPSFVDGVNFRALPTPWTRNPSFSLANPGNSLVFSFSSLNSSEIQRVDVYAMFLNNAPLAGVTGTTTEANWIAPVPTVGYIPQVPASGTSPVSINYTRYNEFRNGRTAAGFTFTAKNRVLVKTLNDVQAFGNQAFVLTDLAALLGVTLPGSVSATIGNQPAFLLQFEVTKKDGSTFSYLNSNPGVNNNPATGRVANRIFQPGSIPYTIILSGEEGSPFIPAVSIRLAP